MNISFFIACGSLGLLGWLFAMLGQIKSLMDKTKAANIIFKPSMFFVDEWPNLVRSVIVIAIALLLITTFVQIKPEYEKFIKAGFVPTGYMGSDIILKILGLVNKKVNNAIDFKTTEADKASGNLNAPTPAT